MGDHATAGNASGGGGGGGGGEEDVYYPSYEEVDEEETNHRCRGREHNSSMGGGGGGDGMGGEDGDEGVCGDFELIPGIGQDHEASDALFEIEGNDDTRQSRLPNSNFITKSPDTMSGLPGGAQPLLSGISETAASSSNSDDDSESGQPAVTTNLKKMKKSLWRGLVVCLREDMSAVGRIVTVEKGSSALLPKDDDDDDDDDDLCHNLCHRLF